MPTWNWQQADWPHFTYDAAALAPLEQQFLRLTGEFVGVFRHMSADDRDSLKIDLISDEALQTSAIEGELLNRDSLQASLRQQFGLDAEARRILPAERGIAEMMVDVYRHFAAPLSHATLYAWHGMVMAGHRGIEVIGEYRKHAEPMQVVSGSVSEPTVHFQAPPSARVPAEMDGFTAWFNDTGPGGQAPLPPLTRAGLAHLYFESIHPFEDGNGRIGRALSEKVLAQALGAPSLIALAHTIERRRKAYYDALEASNKANAVTAWLDYFGRTILQAQRNTLARVDFLIAKARFHDRLRGRLNPRQEKVVARLFAAGIDGFKGGLSAQNYASIAKASPATVTRDLQDLVEKGALTRTGERRYARYSLRLDTQP